MWSVVFCFTQAGSSTATGACEKSLCEFSFVSQLGVSLAPVDTYASEPFCDELGPLPSELTGGKVEVLECAAAL